MSYQLYCHDISEESSSNVLVSVEMAWLIPAATCLERGAAENRKVRIHVFSLFVGETGLSHAFSFVCNAHDGCIKTCWERWRSYSSFAWCTEIEQEAVPLKLA